MNNTNTICREVEVPGFGSVPGCGNELTLHCYITKSGRPDVAIICKHCDSYHRWPKEKE